MFYFIRVSFSTIHVVLRKEILIKYVSPFVEIVSFAKKNMGRIVKKIVIIVVSDLLAVVVVYLLNVFLLYKGKSQSEVLVDTLYTLIPALLVMHGIAWIAGRKFDDR